MFKLVVFCAFATLVSSKPSTLISSGSSSITTEEKTEIRHHGPLTQVHLESTPILKTAEILTPTAEIIRPAAISHEFRSEVHKPILRTTEFIAPSAEIVQPYLNIVPGAISHQFRSDLHSSPLLKTAEIIETKPLLELKSAPAVSHSTKTEIISEPLVKSIVSHPVAETRIIGSSPLIQRTEILERAPLLKKAEISHSYVESTKRDFITAPHGIVGYSPLSIAPYTRLGADPLLIPSLGASEYLVHQPLRYL